MSYKITLALADDEMLFRQGMRAILNKQNDFQVLFDAADGKELVEELRKAPDKPEIIIIDLKMPELNGVEATKIIKEEFPYCKIIALTSHFSKPFILNMISIGAVAYLAKNITPKLMLHTIREVASNGFYYDAEVLKFIKEGKSNNQPHLQKSSLDETFLSTREKEVLHLVCKQHTTKEIAEELYISPRTVEVHRNNLLTKTNSKNVAGLVVFAIHEGLVDIDGPL